MVTGHAIELTSHAMSSLQFTGRASVFGLRVSSSGDVHGPVILDP